MLTTQQNQDTARIVMDLHAKYPEDPQAAMFILVRALEAVCVAASENKGHAMEMLRTLHRTSEREVSKGYDRFKADLRRKIN